MRNSVTLIGHLGKDPEVKVFEKSKRATFSIATNESFKNQKGDLVKDTQWHNVVVWGKLADTAGKYLKKGNLLAVEGKLVHRAFETGKGEKKYYTEVVASDFVMMSKAESEKE